MLENSAIWARQAEEVVIDNPAKIAARISEIGLYPKHPEGKETFNRSGRTRQHPQPLRTDSRMV
ncbi:MAG: hypothetical protein ACLUI3_03100 [Christensenellales bacterium]